MTPEILNVRTHLIVKEQHHRCNMLLLECYFDNPLVDLHSPYNEKLKEFFRTHLNPESHLAHFQAVIPLSKFNNEQIEHIKTSKSFDQILQILGKDQKFCIVLPASGMENYSY